MANEDWLEKFPGLSRLEPGIRAKLIQNSKLVSLPQATQIFGPGKAPDAFLLLVDGIVRVQQVSEGGREIVLYRVSAGESCALTTACLLAFEDYQAEGVAETDVTAVALTRVAFDDLIATSQIFRRFVFTAFSSRVTALFGIIDEVAFSRIDIRLAQRLVTLSAETMHIASTHQQLASELGTAREVISRQMQEFARRGWVSSTRGEVEILNLPALTELAASH